MATSDQQNLIDLGNLFVEDTQNTIEAIDRIQESLAHGPILGFGDGVLAILRDLSESKAEFVIRAQGILSR